MIMKDVKIWINPERFALCEVEQNAKLDIYHIVSSGFGIETIKKAMVENGYFIVDADEDVIVVDRQSFFFKGERYSLNQCSDLWDWFGESRVYEFTYYYDRIVFHSPDRHFYGAFIEDTDNYTKI